MTPPFSPQDKVICIRHSTEVCFNGDINGNCYCIKDQIYSIDQCVWSHLAGWMVSITGELHMARDFVPSPSKEGFAL